MIENMDTPDSGNSAWQIDGIHHEPAVVVIEGDDSASEDSKAESQSREDIRTAASLISGNYATVIKLYEGNPAMKVIVEPLSVAISGFEEFSTVLAETQVINGEKKILKLLSEANQNNAN